MFWGFWKGVMILEEGQKIGGSFLVMCFFFKVFYFVCRLGVLGDGLFILFVVLQFQVYTWFVRSVSRFFDMSLLLSSRRMIFCRFFSSMKLFLLKFVKRRQGLRGSGFFWFLRVSGVMVLVRILQIFISFWGVSQNLVGLGRFRIQDFVRFGQVKGMRFCSSWVGYRRRWLII